MIGFLVCEPYRLIYRPLPKCASTTLFTLFADLGGNRTSSQQRDNLPVVRGVVSPGRGGSYVVKCPDGSVDDLAHLCVVTHVGSDSDSGTAGGDYLGHGSVELVLGAR
jgi:hypothetical protein